MKKKKKKEGTDAGGVALIKTALGHIRPKKRLGQTFMIDPNLLSALVRDGGVGPNDTVLEIGTGTGRLTEALARAAGTVLSIEIDEGLAAIARDRLSSLRNVEIVNADILDGSGSISPRVDSRVGEVCREGPPVVIANLPYAASGRILAALMLWPRGPGRAVVTVQREVGERLAARPGSKAYGKLTVLVQSAADVKVIRTIPPECFWPRPGVHSAVVRLGPKRMGVEALENVSRVAGGVFQHRRKTIRNALLEATNMELTADAVSLVLAREGIAEGVRADSLTPDDFQRVASRLFPPEGPSNAPVDC